MDDLPGIIDVVMEMGAPAEPDDPPPLPFRQHEANRTGSPAISDVLRTGAQLCRGCELRRCAYAADGRHFASRCRRQGLELLPPDPRGLHITAQASGKATGDSKPGAVSTIERRRSCPAPVRCLDRLARPAKAPSVRPAVPSMA